MDTLREGRYLICIGLLAALTIYTYSLRYRSTGESSLPLLERIPKEVVGFACTEETPDADALGLGADATLFRVYRDGMGREVSLFVGCFGAPSENSQIHSPKHCYPGAGWSLVDESSTEILLIGKRCRIASLIISDGARRSAVLYWFSSYDAVLTNEFALKWDQMKSALLGRPRTTAFVRFSTAIPEGRDNETRGELARFAEALAPGIMDVLSGSGASRATSRQRQERMP
jgi:EpsI family protein